MSDNKKTTRAPVVVILGHVDHGKTTLLDYIRKSNVAQKEVGGITQSIGASEVVTKEGKEITFIDTPGHAAFSNMRSRGAKVSDIAILVVASDDGVKPQTKEALEFILQNKIPFIVAATKSDLQTSSIDKVKTDLEKEGVLLEGRGGDVPVIGVSGKTGEGVENLLEMISLISELNSISGDRDGKFEGIVIESGKDKRGHFATIIVKSGSLQKGDEVVTDTESCKVRAIYNYLGKDINQITPGKAGQVIGFSKIPAVGSTVWHKNSFVAVPVIAKPVPLLKKVQEDEIALFLKAKNAGSLEAVLANLPQKALVLASGVGDVSESDVLLAKSLNSSIFCFEVRISSSVKKLAESESVYIESFDLIYKLFERVEELLEKGKVRIIGKANIIASFPYENKKVAGCRIIQGKISVNDKCKLIRNDKEMGTVKIVTIRKGKTEVRETAQGEECGILFFPQLEFTIGDVLLSVAEK